MAGPLIRTKEEHLIFLNGSAQRAAELVLFQGRFGLSGGIPEKRIGVENIVAHEFPDISVEIVSTGAGN